MSANWLRRPKWRCAGQRRLAIWRILGRKRSPNLSPRGWFFSRLPMRGVGIGGMLHEHWLTKLKFWSNLIPRLFLGDQILWNPYRDPRNRTLILWLLLHSAQNDWFILYQHLLVLYISLENLQDHQYPSLYCWKQAQRCLPLAKIVQPNQGQQVKIQLEFFDLNVFDHHIPVFDLFPQVKLAAQPEHNGP